MTNVFSSFIIISASQEYLSPLYLLRYLLTMATLITGSLTGGVKKSSGVVVLSNVVETWNGKVRDHDAESDFLIVGFSPPSSKTQVDVIEEGSGGFVVLKERLRAEQYRSVVTFGAFKDDSDGKFVHFMHTGPHAGAMVKGRASMAKQGILNHLEGCVREISLETAEEDSSDGSSSSSSSPASSSSSSSSTPEAAAAA